MTAELIDPWLVSTPGDALSAARATFTRWLGASYDLGSLDAVLAAAAVEKLDGDPVWLLVVSGSGNAKTETVGALAGAGATVTSTITSEGALLSATSRKDAAKDATGGLLRKLGDRGLLVVKDVTSILSMNRDMRAVVLAALREVYDGRWERNVGTDGGRTLSWTGRLVVIGAVTTAWDSAHAVIASMGDRFALVRVDSTLGRLDGGRQALRNVGHEERMRADLAAACAAVLAEVDPVAAVLDDDVEVLLGVANLVTLARTAVERDVQGDVVDAHQPEAPTRFAKMLGQLVRGSRSLGADRAHALGVALRVAGDSVPPLRLLLLADVAEHPKTRTSDVTDRVQRPRKTVDRCLQELHALGLVRRHTLGGEVSGWHYSLAPDTDRQVLATLVARKVSTPGYGDKEGPRVPTDIPGHTAAPEPPGWTVADLGRGGKDKLKRWRVVPPTAATEGAGDGGHQAGIRRASAAPDDPTPAAMPVRQGAVTCDDTLEPDITDGRAGVAGIEYPPSLSAPKRKEEGGTPDGVGAHPTPAMPAMPAEPLCATCAGPVRPTTRSLALGLPTVCATCEPYQAKHHALVVALGRPAEPQR